MGEMRRADRALQVSDGYDSPPPSLDLPLPFPLFLSLLFPRNLETARLQTSRKQTRVFFALLPRRGREGARRCGDRGRQRRRWRSRKRRRQRRSPPPRIGGLRGALPAGRPRPARRRVPGPFEGVRKGSRSRGCRNGAARLFCRFFCRCCRVRRCGRAQGGLRRRRRRPVTAAADHARARAGLGRRHPGLEAFDRRLGSSGVVSRGGAAGQGPLFFRFPVGGVGGARDGRGGARLARRRRRLALSAFDLEPLFFSLLLFFFFFVFL